MELRVLCARIYSSVATGERDAAFVPVFNEAARFHRTRILLVSTLLVRTR